MGGRQVGALNVIRFPSRENAGELSEVPFRSVNTRTRLPSRSRTARFDLSPLVVVLKTIERPSGENAGLDLLSSVWISRSTCRASRRNW